MCCSGDGLPPVAYESLGSLQNSNIVYCFHFGWASPEGNPPSSVHGSPHHEGLRFRYRRHHVYGEKLGFVDLFPKKC